VADIFFSYKREDRAQVELFVRLLEDEGFSVWWDPTIVAGERFDQVIQREIEGARCVIVAWSQASAEAIWVRDEASAGRDRGILVPFSLDGAKPPLGFRQIETPNLSGWTGAADDPRFRRLLAGVNRVVGHRGKPSADAAEPAPEAPAQLRSGPSAPPAASFAGVPRRRVLGMAAAVGGFGMLSAVGLLFALPAQRRVDLPRPRTEKFDLITVDPRGEPQESETGSAEVFAVPLGNKILLEFSVIPAGEFRIGSPDDEPYRRANEGPRQQIAIKPFAMGRTAVTQAEWAAVVDAVPDPVERALDRHPSFFRGDDLPVETISWHDAMEFCSRLMRLTGLLCRLPSEAEWEYACRATTTTPFHFGPTITPELANYCGAGGAVCGMNNGKPIASDTYDRMSYVSGAYDSGPLGGFLGATVKGRSYPPNRFGLYQMHGNVWEHCLDTGPYDYSDIAKDGSPHLGEQERHVLRGGAWSHNPAICRSAYRDIMLADSVGWQGRVGFRVVCELSSGDLREA
jgi:formylglycine-generating enzyme required for sulfatase activity